MTMVKNASNELVIVGAGEFAQIAYEYFTRDSSFRVVAFSAEEKYIDKKELFGLPIVPFETVEKTYNPSRYRAFVAISFTNLNRVRTRLYNEAKKKGYVLVSYVSSKAFVWHNVEIGDNCFIFENNVLQHMVKIGNNVVLWSGNHVGHRTVIRNNCFISSHCVISGYCDIGSSSFLGVNCCFNDGTKIGDDTVIGSGTVVVKNLDGGKVYVGSPARSLEKSSLQAFGVRE